MKKRALITDLILDHQDSDTFYAQLIDELEEEHPGFISRLDEYTALYTLGEQKIIALILKTTLISNMDFIVAM